jgi:hypothetical protein
MTGVAASFPVVLDRPERTFGALRGKPTLIFK